MMIHQSSQPGDMEHLPVSLRIGHWVSFPMETSTGVFSTSQNGLGTRNPILETNPLPLCQRHVSIMGHNKQPSSSASLWLAHTNLRTPSSQVFGLLLLSMGGHGWNHGPSPQAFNTPKKQQLCENCCAMVRKKGDVFLLMACLEVFIPIVSFFPGVQKWNSMDAADVAASFTNCVFQEPQSFQRCPTVDGRNPSPPGMYKILYGINYQPQLVSWTWAINSSRIYNLTSFIKSCGCGPPISGTFVLLDMGQFPQVSYPQHLKYFVRLVKRPFQIPSGWVA